MWGCLHPPWDFVLVQSGVDLVHCSRLGVKASRCAIFCCNLISQGFDVQERESQKY